MERLTERDENGFVISGIETNTENGSYDIWDCDWLEKCLARLAASEDTGLEPEEITAIAGLASENCAKTADKIDQLLSDDKELEEYRALGPIDRLRKLAQADRLLGKDICLGKESISGEVTEIAINSDGIFAYVRSGGGGFYIKPIDVLEESDNGKERLP